VLELGPRGTQLIQSFETLRLEAYLPTPNDVPTIGWGHTKGVKLGMTCTVQQAQQWFAEDTAVAVSSVNAINATVALSQSMFDALVSLAFNAGVGAIGSTSTVGKALRAGSYFDAWRGMSLWTKQAGKDLRGLASRRSHEMALFMEDRLP
jgi:lysozyme